MPDKPPYIPTGIGMGMIIEGDDRVGVLTFETAQGNFDFAVNTQAVDVLRKALDKIEMRLQSGEAG